MYLSIFAACEPNPSPEDRDVAIRIVAGETRYTYAQTRRVADHWKVCEDTIDVITQPACQTAFRAGRIVLDGPAFDVGEPLADSGAGDRDAEFNGSEDGVGDKVSRLQGGSWL